MINPNRLLWFLLLSSSLLPFVKQWSCRFDRREPTSNFPRYCFLTRFTNSTKSILRWWNSIICYSFLVFHFYCVNGYVWVCNMYECLCYCCCRHPCSRWTVVLVSAREQHQQLTMMRIFHTLRWFSTRIATRYSVLFKWVIQMIGHYCGENWTNKFVTAIIYSILEVIFD